MSGPLPAITHLQFLVLAQLSDGDAFGRDIRLALAARRVRRTGPAFYQMMARLEEAGLIEGWYDQKVVDGQIIKERCYRMTALGRKAWGRTRTFYADFVREGWSRA